jgi:hypothetical protein
MVYREGYGMVTKSRAAEIDRELSRQRQLSPNRTEIFDFKPVERGSWVYRDGQLIPKGAAMLDDIVKKNRKRGDHPAPMVMSDIEEYRNMVDGKPITSRSEHREFLKRHNLIEVGNEAPKAPAPKLPSKSEIGNEIKETIEQLRAGYVNPDEGVLPVGAEEPQLEPIIVDGGIKTGDVIRSDVLPE